MIYLVEIDVLDEASGQLETLRFGSRAYTTRRSDDPPNAPFRSRLKDAGNYERYLFGQGRTFGDSEVGVGEIVLVNADGRLDFMLECAFDGRALRIYGLPDANSPWGQRETLLVGTMEQASFTGRTISIRLRDRLDLLRKPILTQTYLGTTINGGLPIAEGTADLKDARKPGLWGRGFTIPAVCVDQFDNVYQVSAWRIHGVTVVRDNGVKLAATQDYATLALLKAAAIPAGSYATCLALGLVRTGVRPNGVLTVDAFEGATLADRSAARIAARMLAGLGQTSAADVEALLEANPAECGYWLGGGETSALATAGAVLASVGASISADRFGAYRMARLELPSGAPVAELTRNRAIDRGEGFSRLPTNDPGDGVPSPEVTIQWGRSYGVFSAEDLRQVASDDPFRSFAVQEWRQATETDAQAKERHPGREPLVFETYFTSEADARAEARRRLAIYARRRDLFQIVQASSTVSQVDPGECVLVRIPRFGMEGGRLMRVLGVVPVYAGNTTTLEVWG